MNAQVSSRSEETSNPQPGTARTGRHARPVTTSAAATSEIYRNHSQDRIRAADRILRDAHARVRASGADSDVVSTAFGAARDALTEARQIVHEARKELYIDAGRIVSVPEAMQRLDRLPQRRGQSAALRER